MQISLWSHFHSPFCTLVATQWRETQWSIEVKHLWRDKAECLFLIRLEALVPLYCNFWLIFRRLWILINKIAVKIAWCLEKRCRKSKTEEERKGPWTTKEKETKQNRSGVKTTAKNKKQQDWGRAWNWTTNWLRELRSSRTEEERETEVQRLREMLERERTASRN